jgi:hypothetical protein
MSARFSGLTALMLLRASAANIVELTDAVLLSSKWDATSAKRLLPDAIRILQFRSQRALVALQAEEGQ